MSTSPPREFVVPEGVLLYHDARDERFPYIYEVKEHPLVDCSKWVPVLMGRILVFIADTSEEAMRELLDFEEGLVVPMGSDEYIRSLGNILSYI